MNLTDRLNIETGDNIQIIAFRGKDNENYYKKLNIYVGTNLKVISCSKGTCKHCDDIHHQKSYDCRSDKYCLYKAYDVKAILLTCEIIVKKVKRI